MKNISKILMIGWILAYSLSLQANDIYIAKDNTNIVSKDSVNSIKEVVYVALGSDEILYQEEGIRVNKVYPNPANEAAYIKYQINEDIQAKITIRNLLGRVVGEYELPKNQTKIKINTNELESGVYFYTLSIGHKTLKAKKLIVEHK